MTDYPYDEEYPEFEYLVSIEGFLVPLAHVKAIGWVETSLPGEDAPSAEGPQFFFRVHLDQPVSSPEDQSTRDLAAFFSTPEEAEDARLELARKVNDFYKRLQQSYVFGKNVH
jgi:hypothetical protein